MLQIYGYSRISRNTRHCIFALLLVIFFLVTLPLTWMLLLCFGLVKRQTFAQSYSMGRHCLLRRPIRTLYCCGCPFAD